MRLLLLLAAALAGLALLLMVGLLQLPWASSELSYWLQLILAVALMAAVLWWSGRISSWRLALAVGCVSFVTASMPVENRLILMGLGYVPPEQALGAFEVISALTPPLFVLLIHLALLAISAFAARAWFNPPARHRSRSADAGPAPAPPQASDI